MADFSISDMPWLGQPADPAGSLARGIQAGSMIAQNRNQREALALRRMEFEEHQKERAKLLPLELTLKKQQEQLNANIIEAELEQRQNIVNSNSVMNGLAREISASMQDPDKGPEDAQLQLLQAIVHSPGIVETPRFQQMSKLVGDSLSAKLKLIEEKNKLAAMRGSAYTPGFETIINPQTGKSHVVFRSGAGSAQLMDDNSFSPEMRTITNPDTGDKTTMVRTGPNTWKEQDQGEMVQVTTPEGTTTTIAKGKPASNIATATANEAEKKLAANEISLSQIAESIPLITPSTVGPRGVVNEAVEIAANIASPGSMATDVTRARQTFRATAQQQYAALKVDSQINKLEAEAMKQIADITKIAESDPTAREKYLVLQDLTALRSVLLSHQLGKIAPDNALRAMRIGQVARAWKRGDLTEAEVERWNELHGVVK